MGLEPVWLDAAAGAIAIFRGQVGLWSGSVIGRGVRAGVASFFYGFFPFAFLIFLLEFPAQAAGDPWP